MLKLGSSFPPMEMLIKFCFPPLSLTYDSNLSLEQAQKTRYPPTLRPYEFNWARGLKFGWRREREGERRREREGGMDTLQFRGLEKEKLRQIRFSSPSIVCDIDPLRNENFRLVLFVRLFSCGRFQTGYWQYVRSKNTNTQDVKGQFKRHKHQRTERISYQINYKIDYCEQISCGKLKQKCLLTLKIFSNCSKINQVFPRQISFENLQMQWGCKP